MTTLIVPSAPGGTFSKILLSPVFTNLKVFLGDKIDISGDYKRYPLDSQDGVIWQQDLDEPYITELIIPS